MPKYTITLANSHAYSGEIEIEANDVDHACRIAMEMDPVETDAGCIYEFETDDGIRADGVYSIEVNGEEIDVPSDFKR